MNRQTAADISRMLRILETVLDRSTVDTDIGRIIMPGPTYLGMWARDTAIQCLGLNRLGKLDLSHELLLRYWSFQITPRSDPRTFVFRNKRFAAWEEADAFQPTRTQLKAESGAFPTCVYMETSAFPAGTSEIYSNRADPDSTAWLIIALQDYCLRSGDLDCLRQLAPRVNAAIRYLRSRDTDGDHLLEQGPNEDWADVLLREGKVSYTQAVWYGALRAATDMFQAIGQDERARSHRREAELVSTAINQLLMTAYGYYANYIVDGAVSLRRSLDTALLTAFGVSEGSEARRVLDVLGWLEGPFGRSVAEPGYAPHAMGPSKYPPGQYQNEGIWPWITSYLALAWAKVGEPAVALDIIRSLLPPTSDTVYEWIDALTGERHHEDFATGAAALAWAIDEAGLAKPDRRGR